MIYLFKERRVDTKFLMKLEKEIEFILVEKWIKKKKEIKAQENNEANDHLQIRIRTTTSKSLERFLLIKLSLIAKFLSEQIKQIFFPISY